MIGLSAKDGKSVSNELLHCLSGGNNRVTVNSRFRTSSTWKSLPFTVLCVTFIYTCLPKVIAFLDFYGQHIIADRRLFGIQPRLWTDCGPAIQDYECANISVPLDHHNASDPRRVSIALTRLPATNTTFRKGSIFVNPGGPGKRQRSCIYEQRKLKGAYQYDIIGFDPRGINMSRPYHSCFDSLLDEQVFGASNFAQLNVPVNMTVEAVQYLERQVTMASATVAALSTKCADKTGDLMAYLGTEAVVHDIDYLSKVIEGKNARINFWGFSYGTIIGQYMIDMLPPERIGKIIIDAVANPIQWSDYDSVSADGVLDDYDNLLSAFTQSCVAAGNHCALSSYNASEILAKIDETLDSLYWNPATVTDLRIPAVVTAGDLRSLIFLSMYKISLWPMLAEQLRDLFEGNFTSLVSMYIDPEGASKPDRSTWSAKTVMCIDKKPLDKPHAAAEFTEDILESMVKHTRRAVFLSSFCDVWQGIYPRRNQYESTFAHEDDMLQTPILILSNTFDPVTPLVNARNASERLGNNTRLVQQVDGYGHRTITHTSFCTIKIVRAYMTEGVVPSADHTFCQVDEQPFFPFG
ncbi:hypothetical protein NEOLEDRAFT_1054630 [Neolentinus lepideus HHB14362 ss-1]|uniref:Peptidase S33 tripeptidyl aminopeptidase-like C-terminal domain-containing protein n=1 Tax=Neolentinus lepideus HHB14362 ss-1 TaxID=1314782 RepID=A0A165VSZ1_9AGAM|nr:hypothetical protein NEOLEDRAFT_1054630 [Neolentinus lepideus HHB14362 ss-1]